MVTGAKVYLRVRIEYSMNITILSTLRPHNEVTAKACEDARNGKIGFSTAIVCEVLAIPLRDRYMASRGIKAKL